MFLTTLRLFRPATILAVTGVAALAGCGSPPAETTAQPKLEGPSAAELVDQMRALYREADSYAGNSEVVEVSVRRGEGVERQLTYYAISLAFERPARLRLSIQEAPTSAGDGRSREVASNGKVLRAAMSEYPAQVFESSAPSEITIDNFIPEPRVRNAVLQVDPRNYFPHAVMLLDKEGDKPLFPRDQNPHRLGPKRLGDRECYRVAMENPKGRRILWIDSETKALRRVEIPTAGHRKEIDPNNEFLELSVRVDFHNAQINSKIDPATFDLEIPGGARRVRELVDPPPPAPPVWLGEEVAEFHVQAADGQSIASSDWQGKPVLLKFWFTDCVPCQQQTPVFESAWKELQGQALRCYAVSIDSQQVPSEHVQKTWTEWGGTMPILRDTEHQAFEQLHIVSTPTTVMIDAEGRLQYFEVGAQRSPEPLIAAAQRILAGEKIAEVRHDLHRRRVEEFQQALDDATIPD